MKETDIVKGLKVLGIAYSKEFTKEECSTYYEFLQEYSYETFKTAVKNIIKKSKFLPKISELVKECDSCKELIKNEVIDFMWNSGYFKKGTCGELSDAQALRNYDKSIKFIEEGKVPKWLQEDMNYYYKLMKQEKLSCNEQLRIGQV